MKRIAILGMLFAAACAPPASTAPTPRATPATSTAAPAATLRPFLPLPSTHTPPAPATPWAFATETFEDSVPTAIPQQFLWERSKPLLWTFVLLGSDSMTHRREDHTDAFIIVLLRLPQDGSRPQVSLLSIARDTYVFLPGYGNTRINNVWALAGEQGLADTLRYNFGLDYDGYVYARLDALSAFINDVLGGVTVNVPEGVLDKCGDLIVNFSPGPHDMDGAMAACYARVRIHSSDYPRMARQQSLLLAMRDRALELAGDDPFGFLYDSLLYVRDLHIQMSFDIWGFVTTIQPIIVRRGLPQDFALYRLMPPFSIHFDHPTTGAWLLAPPQGECMAWLVDQAVLQLPWLDATGNPLEGPCYP